MADLLIFDRHDILLAVLSNEVENSCPFWDAPFKEILNQGSFFEFTASADHEDSQYLVAENQVAFMDKDGAFRLFVIKEPERIDDENGPLIHCVCEPSMLELNEEPLEDVRPYNTTLKDALTRAISKTRWLVGQTAELGINSTNYYYESVTEAIQKIINTWGGELRDRVEISGNKITGRYIDILARRGADTGKRWEIDKDILSISHKVQSYPKTALYGRGSSLEIEDEEGNATGGYSRKITFAEMEWKKSNGDPVDKPKGQVWIGDPEALKIYGRKNTDGSLRHRFGFYENGEQEDPAALLQVTWEALQEQKHPIDNYEMDVFLLEQISGYEHEKVRIGDTTFAIDRSFAKPIEVEERVISYEYDISDPDNTGKVELGQYIDLYADDARLDKIEAILNDKSGIWDKGSKPITDEKIPNIVPGVPTNVKASGLFASIMIEWDYISALYVAAYEVYASQIKGFTPDASNLVWRGKAGSYVYKANANEQWYFKVRAINTHGTSGNFSIEVFAQTARIISDDILFGPEIAEKLRELSETAKLLADGTIDFSTIADDVKEKIDEAKEAAENAKQVGDSAQKAAETTALIGNEAQQKANAAQTAADNAQTAADNAAEVGDAAQQKADQASKTAAQAQTDAASAVTNANNAVNRSNQASSDAQSAITKAQSAFDEATSAHDVADAAKTASGTANTIANDAKTLANAANSNAASALTNAQSALDVLKDKADKVTTYTKTEVDNAVNSKVSTTTYTADQNGVITRFNSAESRITQTEKDIALKASKSDLDALTGRVTSAEASITVQAGQISSKADKSYVDTIKGIVDSHSTSIQQNADAIKLKASQSSVDSLTGRVSTAESNISINAQAITTKISTVDADKKYATQSSLTQTSSSLTSQITAVQTNLDNLEIGGRNILLKTNHQFDWVSASFGQSLTKDSTGMNFYPDYKSLRGKTITISFEVNTTNLKYGTVNPWLGVEKRIDFTDKTEAYVTLGGKAVKEGTTNGWVKYTLKKDILDREISGFGGTTVLMRDATGNVSIRNIQIEIGKYATDWTPAPEDMATVVQFSQLQQTVDGISTQVSKKVDQSSYDSYVQQTATSLSSKISITDADSKYATQSSLTQTANGLQTQVNSKADSSVVTQLSNVVDTKISTKDADGKFATQSQLTQTSSSLTSTITTAQNSADTAQKLAQSMTTAKMLHKDPTFKNGTNSVSLYNNAGNGLVSVTRIAKPSDAPTTSTHVMEVKTTGAVTPGWGGYVQPITARENAKFLVKIIAKIPVGYTLNVASNSMGTGYTDKILSSNKGTGKYQEYIRLVECGDSGTFSSGGHFYLSGGNTPTTADPLIWYVAYATVFDITDSYDVEERLSTSESQIIQLATDISLRVSKNDVVNQINVSTEGILIDGKKVRITGQTTIDNAVIKDAMIASLTASKLTAGTIDANVITVKNLTAAAFVTGTITATSGIIASLDASKITTGTLDANKVIVANLSASVIITGTLDATKVTVKSLTASAFVAGTITAESGVIGSIDASKITVGTLDANKVTIANLSVGTGAIQNLAVTNAKLANLSVNTAQIIDGAITNAKIGNLAVDDAKIASISADKIKVGTLVGIKLTGNTIEGGSITGSYFYNFGVDGDVRINNGRLSATSMFVLKDGTFHSESGYVTLRSYDDYIYLQTPSEVRVTRPRTFDQYMPLRASQLLAETQVFSRGDVTSYTNGVFKSDIGYVVLRSASTAQVYLQGNEVNCTLPSNTSSYVQVRASSFKAMNNAFTGAGNTVLTTDSTSSYVVVRASDSQPVYLQGLEIRATKATDANTYVIMKALRFEPTSLEKYKTEIKPMEGSAIAVINATDINQYRFKSEVKDGIDKINYGLIIGEGYRTPEQFMGSGKESIDLYSAVSISMRAIQELSQQDENHILKMANLEAELASARVRISKLEQLLEVA
ncbi:hypothetical protein BIV60_17105 [Bacillus sp. MUM 116]|uniref:phage tail spike protein n=1 Tax=Bacillus sp. MUM 116 TaxID=1678002 RepID=UPI0008F59793|nr:phage tail spike protein [Bacillus sp. MUM 116]OIK11972.1 hypothetical protein BIV60_17105 [Bacillus sp. MUM 116]